MRTRTLLSPVVALIACVFLSGCGTDTAAPKPHSDSPATTDTQTAPSDSAASAGTASASIGGREFTFELDGCLVYEDREAEISGPGGESGSPTPSYLDGGSTEMGSPALGEFRIDIGVQGPFESSDDFLALGSIFDEEFSIVPDGDGYLVSGKAWDSGGADLGPGTLRFTCG